MKMPANRPICKFFARCLRFAFASPLLPLLMCTAFAAQPMKGSEQYGKVLFCDTFETYPDGTDMISNQSTPAYVSDAFKSKFGGVTYASDGHLHKAVKVDGKGMLYVGKKDKGQQWPQIVLLLSKPLTDGEYTLSYNAVFPNDSNGFYSTAMRFNLTKQDGTSALADPTVNTQKDVPVTHTYTMKVGKNGIGCEYQSITSFLVFCSCDNTTEGTYMLMDDLVLYGKTDKAVFTMPDGTKLYDYYTAGEPLTLPAAMEFEPYCGKTQTAVALRKDGKDYAFGETYQTAADEKEVSFEVVVQKETFEVYFDADTRAATFEEVMAAEGDTVVLPSLADPDFLGWYVPGLSSFRAGESFRFNYDALRDDFDNDGRLTVRALYRKSASLNAPVLPSNLPADFDDVTLAGLLAASVSIGDSVFGTTHTFMSDADIVSYAVSAGLLAEERSPSSAATFGDAFRILANTLPARFYPTLTNDPFPHDIPDDLRPFADKLYRAGILDGTEDVSQPLSGIAFKALAAKLCDKSKRTVETGRTVFVFGDSLCDPGPNYNSWIEKLRAYFDDNIEVVNYAVGGYNAGHFTFPGDPSYDKFTDMLSRIKKGDYVFVALGTNDATLWMWKDHPELSQGGQQKAYETSRDHYQRYTEAARKAGAVPVYIVPVSRDIDRMTNDPYYLAYDNRIVNCMRDANTFYHEYTPIVNFKTVTDPLINEQMTKAQREAIYKDSVHYTDYGADFVAQIFRDIVLDDDNPQLAALRTHLSDGFDLGGTEEGTLKLHFFVNSEGSIAVSNESPMPQPFTFVFASTDADGRLKTVRIDKDKVVIDGAPVTLSFQAVEDAAFTLEPDPAKGTVLLGKLYSFDENMSPVAEPLEIYQSSKSAMIDAGELF